MMLTNTGRKAPRSRHRVAMVVVVALLAFAACYGSVQASPGVFSGRVTLEATQSIPRTWKYKGDRRRMTPAPFRRYNRPEARRAF